MLLGLSLPNGLGRFDHLIYDQLLRTLARPAPQDIVLIAIDDGSLQQLGKWPWPRATHAELLEQLKPARAVAFDIIFSEPDRYGGSDDQVLADAIRRHGKVVLPGVLQPDNISLERPTAMLADAAAGIGYINLVPDDDGVARRFMARSREGTPHLVETLLQVAGEQPAHPDMPAGTLSNIRYAGPAGQFQMLPYNEVLAGRIPPSYWKDKLVIVGAWATGLGDNFATPMSLTGIDMAGMEILANIINVRRSGLEISSWPAWATFLAGWLPLLLLCLALRKLSPRRGLYAVCAAVFLTLLGCWLLLRLAHAWVPPGAALLVLLASYPLWSWRSQELALRSLDATLLALRREDQNFPEIPQARQGHDLLDSRIHELEQALERVRNLRGFLANSLESTPDPTLICTPEGNLRYLNRAASIYLTRLPGSYVYIGQHISHILDTAFPSASPESIRQWLNGDATPDEVAADTEEDDALPAPTTLEHQDRLGMDWLLQRALLLTPDNETAGMVISMTDISVIRNIERRREQSLRFLSHDMRAPQASILAQVALRQQETQDAGEQLNLERIANYAGQTLELVDGFVQLSRAESATLNLRDTDLHDLLCECCDRFYSLAKERDIRITQPERPEHDSWITADTTLLQRAVGNLLHNAIKFSPNSATIECGLEWDAGNRHWIILIRDHGPGVPVEDQETLFDPFAQNEVGTAIRNPGVGLGLAFVQTVAKRHHGRAWVRNADDGGAIFHLSLAAAETTIPPELSY